MVKTASTAGKAKSHPSYVDMVVKALSDNKDRKGASRQAIAKYIKDNFEVGGHASHVKSSLRHALEHGVEAKKFAKVEGVFAFCDFFFALTLTIMATKQQAKERTAALAFAFVPSPRASLAQSPRRPPRRPRRSRRLKCARTTRSRSR